tara:strand:- start:7429 stop:8265 length:837 start_codon:yes stop_codon:yes gene_type:complete
MVYIIVPVFKRLAKTKEFLASVRLSISVDYHIVLVDDSLDYEHYEFYIGIEGISIAKGNGELYWGGGINLGLTFLKENSSVDNDDIIVFANNDIVLREDTFSVLHTYLKADSKSIFHPKLIDQTGNSISPGSRIITWFPFHTDHKLSESQDLTQVDIASARFLVFSSHTLSLLGGINPLLPHYGGDNDFTYRAKKLGINTYIVSSAICYVDESDTGEKASNMKGILELLKSFKSIKSPNSLEYRYKFVSSHFNPVFSVAIVFSMSIKAIVAYLIKKKY